MISRQVVFRVVERKNTFRKSGAEWALTAQLVGHSPWTIKAWEKKPKDITVSNAKEIILRSFEFYHNHLRIPKFDLTVEDE